LQVFFISEIVLEMKLGKLIAGYRKANEITLDTLASEIGIDRVALWRLENNKFSGFKQWPKILAWLFTPDK